MHNNFDFTCPHPVKPDCGDFGHNPPFPTPPMVKPPKPDYCGHKPGPCGPKPDDCHINPYNKITFNNKKEAVQLLSNKDLHPGELAFAYYYDNRSIQGINAIAAVGNIKIGAQNILFENSEDVLKWVSDLSSNDMELSDDIKTVRRDIENIFSQLSYINNTPEKLNELDQTVTEILNQQVVMDSSITSINGDIDVINSSIITLEDYIKKIENLVGDASSNLAESDSNIVNINAWIEKHESAAAVEHTRILTEFNKALSDISVNFSETAADMSADLRQLQQEFETLLATEVHGINENILNLNADLRDEIKTGDTKVTNDLLKELSDTGAELQAQIDTVVLDIKNLQLKSDNVTSEINTAVTDVSAYLATRIETVKTELETSIKATNDKILAHEVSVTQAFKNLENENAALVNSKISDLKNDLDIQVSNLYAKIETVKSATEAKIETAVSDYKTRIDTVKNDLELTMRLQKSAILTEFNELEADLNRLNESKFERKGAIKQITPGYKGGIKLSSDNEISLDIDSNGILHVNGVEYILTRNY